MTPVTKEHVSAALKAWWDSPDDLYLWDIYKDLLKQYQEQQKESETK